MDYPRWRTGMSIDAMVRMAPAGGIKASILLLGDFGLVCLDFE